MMDSSYRDQNRIQESTGAYFDLTQEKTVEGKDSYHIAKINIAASHCTEFPNLEKSQLAGTTNKLSKSNQAHELQKASGQFLNKSEIGNQVKAATQLIIPPTGYDSSYEESVSVKSSDEETILNSPNREKITSDSTYSYNESVSSKREEKSYSYEENSAYGKASKAPIKKEIEPEITEDQDELDFEIEEAQEGLDFDIEEEHMYGPVANENQPVTSGEGSHTILSLKDFRDLTKDVHDALTHQELDDVYAFILDKGIQMLQQASEDKQEVQARLENKDITILATKSGKLFINLNTLGEGHYKVATKMMQIGAKNLQKLQENFAQVKAVAIEKKSITGDDPASKLAMKEAENERYINQALYDLQKAGNDLSNVCVGKSVKVQIKDEKGVNVIKNGFISPFANGGDANKILEGPELSLKEKSKIVEEMTKGVAQLHKMGIVHRDIKPDNFLLFKDSEGNLNVKIADFGKSSYMDDEKSVKERVSLPFAWQAPEWGSKENPRLSTEGEIYQLGVTFYQVFTQTPIETLHFNFKGLDELVKHGQNKPVLQSALKCTPEELQILKGIVSTVDPTPANIFRALRSVPESWPGMSQLDPNIQNMIKSMVDQDPSHRPTAEQVLEFCKTLAL